MQKVQLRLLTFGKNKYGGGHDLNGCVNDTKNLSADLTKLWSGIDCRPYTNSQAVCANYTEKTTEAKKFLDPGAAILVLMDSCFSGTGTRLYLLNPGRVKNRFLDPGLPFIPKVKSKVFINPEMTWAAMSAGGEHQTVADAYFNMYEGAFTHYARQVLRKGMTPRDWHYEIRKLLPSLQFDQAPELEGPADILDRKIGDGQWLIIHNSSHGSWTYDKNADEPDGRDEGIFFDYLLIDDKINELLRA